MMMRRQIAAKLLLLIFALGQGNAFIHFFIVKHDFCAEHFTASGHHEEGGDRKDKKRHHSEHDDCQVVAQLTHASVNTTSDTVIVNIVNVVALTEIIDDDLHMANHRYRFFLAPSNSPPVFT